MVLEEKGSGSFTLLQEDVKSPEDLIKDIFVSIAGMIGLEGISIFLCKNGNDPVCGFSSSSDLTADDIWSLYKEKKLVFNESKSDPLGTLPGESYEILAVSTTISSECLEGIQSKARDTLQKLFMDYTIIGRKYRYLLDCLDSVDEGISACDEKGFVTYINQPACNMLKSDKKDILNQDLKTFIPNSILVKAIKSRKSVLDVEYQIELPSHSVNLMNSAYPVFDDADSLVGAIDIYRKKTRSIKVASDLMGHYANYDFSNFIGESRQIKETIDIAKKFSKSDKNVLIIGDSGTGKELMAQAIHNHSSRKDGPFVAINCASYPRDLFESELFGYDEGAFTGAKKGGKIGKFELANGGTIFLDEIGEMHMHLQAKLLRIIEDRSLSRIGSNKMVDIDVRIIAATNRNLEDMILRESFREDLYYRLKVLFLSLPPLKDRGTDVLKLCDYFIHKFSNDTLKGINGLDDDAAKLVMSYDWPGNIRELENIISLSLFYCEGEYLTKDNLMRAGLITDEDSLFSGKSRNKELSTITTELILKTLRDNDGNKKKTAEQLGISRNTIYRKLKSYEKKV
jgi:transcriptional regulator with PAS, ATPase and Fis domain